MDFKPLVPDSDCFIYRIFSCVFISVTSIAIAFNVRFVMIDRHRLSPLVLSLIASSSVLAFVSLPYVAVQAVKCYPVEIFFVCNLQGFTCFICGISVMYTMSLLSVIQYIRLFYNTSLVYRLIEHKNSFLIPVCCWCISLIWSFPPFVNVNPGFVREGQGFDCGLDWKKSDLRSRLYLFLAFLLIYFLPLFCLLFTNIRVLIVIRKLVHRRCPIVSETSATMSVVLRHRLIDIFTVAESGRLKRLRIDRRFAKATLITVIHYLIAWTPYAVCGLLQMFFSARNTHYEIPSMILTASALIPKMAVIIQPTIYIFSVRPPGKRTSVTSATLK